MREGCSIWDDVLEYAAQKLNDCASKYYGCDGCPDVSVCRRKFDVFCGKKILFKLKAEPKH